MWGAPNARERVRGIEPPYRAWEASALPLSYTRMAAVPNPARVVARDRLNYRWGEDTHFSA
jgi:hypothetical protein